MKQLKIYLIIISTIFLTGCGNENTTKSKNEDKLAKSLGFIDAKEMNEIRTYGEFNTKVDFEDVAYLSPSYCFSVGEFKRENGEEFYRKNCQDRKILWMAHYSGSNKRVTLFPINKKVDLDWKSFGTSKLKAGDIILFRGVAGPLNLFHPDVYKAEFIGTVTNDKAWDLTWKSHSYLNAALDREQKRYEEKRMADKVDYALTCSGESSPSNTKANFLSFSKSGYEIARLTTYKSTRLVLESSFKEYELIKEVSDKPDNYHQFKVVDSYAPDDKYEDTIHSIRVERDTLAVSVVRYSTCFGGPNFRPYSCLRKTSYKCDFAEPQNYQSIIENDKKHKNDFKESIHLAKLKAEEIKQKAIDDQLKKNKI
jgi:hypothetical protein